MSVEDQLDGAMCHGLGEALFEEVIFDSKGRVVNNTLGDYRIPTPVDVPSLRYRLHPPGMIPDTIKPRSFVTCPQKLSHLLC
jgi:CO/xanthine dehydrogenase Mo-binding subunit